MLEADLENRTPELLKELLADTGWRISAVSRDLALPGPGSPAVDFVFSVLSDTGRGVVWVEVKSHPRPSLLAPQALLLARQAQQAGAHVAVAYLVPVATLALQRTFAEAGVGYFDTQGACRLRWPGFYLERPGETKAEREASTGPSAQAVFGPQGRARHRVLRALLSYPGRRWHQTELSEESGVSIFPVHEVVRFLLREHWADYQGRGPQKVVFLTRPGDLLERWSHAWEESWKQGFREAGRFYSLATNPGETMSELVEAAQTTGSRLGFTLAAGANQFRPLLRDEAVHAWVVGDLRRLAGGMDLDEVERGANVVLLPARDEGLLYLPPGGRESLAAVADPSPQPVSPVQLYLDMRAAGGRYAEQAERLRQEVLAY